jgi:flavin reductase (DIM6/NTAB) family NADH-FMN oxidoreductase RutF
LAEFERKKRISRTNERPNTGTMHVTIEPSILYVGHGIPACKGQLAAAQMTSEPSDLVQPGRVTACPIQLEGVLETVRRFGTRPDKAPEALAFEVRIVRAYIEPSLLFEGEPNRIDPDKWRPLMMSFCRFYGLGGQVFESTLAEISESSYRPAAHMVR